MDTPQPTDVEIDVRALMATLVRRLPFLIIFVIVVAACTWFVLGRIAPVYKSETTVLIENGESDLTRTDNTGGGDASAVIDDQAIASQVQLIRSRDLAAAVIKKLDLASQAAFDSDAEPSFLTKVLMKVGLAQEESSASAEDRASRVYYKGLTVTAVDKSRVIAIDFSSTDPEMAAAVANAVAAEYISLQADAKRTSTSDAADWLSEQIVDLRQKVQDAEARVENFRNQNDLFDSGGTTPLTLPQQQLSDLNAELTRVRAARADAEAKAQQIRIGLNSNSVPNLTDVLNSQLIQRLVEQQVALRSQIAQLNATLLPGHPKMRELNAEVGDLDRQIVVEAKKILESLEAEAKVAAARENELAQSLGKLKETAATANDAGVHLRALEREAAAQRDLLDSYLRRYREAVARDSSGLPADARVISRATVPGDPDFPKKMPMTLAVTAASLLLAIAFILLRELASGRPMRRTEDVVHPLPMIPGAVAADGHARWADDRGVSRMMPSEATLVPEMVDRVEESLAAIATQIVEGGQKRVLVTLSEGSDDEGRPLGAVALARALARNDGRVVLVDFRGDGADAASMGESRDLPGFSDLFDGDASFAQVIFRDRKSRVHFIPSGRKAIGPGLIDEEQLETILSALTLTYDYVLLDTGDDMIPIVAPGCGVALVVSEHGGGDPRTVRAFDRITAVTDAHILLLVVDPAARQHQREAAEAEKAAEGAAA